MLEIDNSSNFRAEWQNKSNKFVYLSFEHLNFYYL